MFLEIKENKSYINPLEVCGFHGVFPFTEKGVESEGYLFGNKIYLNR